MPTSCVSNLATHSLWKQLLIVLRWYGEAYSWELVTRADVEVIVCIVPELSLGLQVTEMPVSLVKLDFSVVVKFGLLKAHMQDRSPSLPGCKTCVGYEPGATEILYVKLEEEANTAEGRVNWWQESDPRWKCMNSKSHCTWGQLYTWNFYLVRQYISCLS